jgi:quercetin dioxygenase-like cupin family protein
MDIGSLPARRAPLPAGPTIRPLVGPPLSDAGDTSEPAAVLHVSVPAGAAVPEHDHGPSRVTLIPLQGRIRLRHNHTAHELGPTTVTTIEIGERVSLDNPWPEDATLIAVASPPDFAAALSDWPITGTADTADTDAR